MTGSMVILGVTAFIVAFVLLLLRSRRLRDTYAALWVIVGLATIALAAFPGLLETAAHVLGFAVPSNLLFLVAIVLLLGVCLHLSLELSNLEDETRTLAEVAAILDMEVRRLQADSDSAEASGEGTRSEALLGRSDDAPRARSGSSR